MCGEARNPLGLSGKAAPEEDEPKHQDYGEDNRRALQRSRAEPKYKRAGYCRPFVLKCGSEF